MSRLSVNINPVTHQEITRLMRDMSATEVIRRAVSCYAFVKAEQDDGYNLLLVGDHGDRRKVEFQ
jgi:hypothetical protein